MTSISNKDDDFLFLEMLNNQFIDELKLMLILVLSIKENSSNLAIYNKKKVLLSEILGQDQLEIQKQKILMANLVKNLNNILC
jgi:hypothetical protein